MRNKLLACALAIAVAACGGAKKEPAMVADPLSPVPDEDGGPSAATFSELGDGGADAAAAPDKGAPPAASASKGDEEGARALLAQFVAPNADHAALTRALRPTTDDYKAIFDAETAPKIEAGQAKDWNKAVIKPKPTQTEVKVWSASGADLASGAGAAADFPAGYKKVGKHFLPTVTVFRFKFVEPGKDVGTAYDGLAFVNGHWVISPKPWKALEAKDAEPAEHPKPKGKRKKKK